MRPIVASLSTLLLLAGLAGCSSDDMESSAPDAPSVTDGAGDSGGGEAPGGENGIDVPVYTPVEGRALIVRMTVGLEVLDIGDGVEDLIRAADRHRGQLASSRVDVDDEKSASGELVFRMPPEEVDAFIDELDPQVGRTVSLNGTTEDVTGQLRDLDAQIEMAEISVDRVSALLSESTRLADIILLEGELTQRQTRLEQLRAQKASIDQLVALATVTVWLSVSDDPGGDDPVGRDVADAFAAGWDAFVAALVGIALAIGYAAPFVVLAALVLLVILLARRRWRRRPSTAASAETAD